jgi:hypothetical protein
VLPVPNPFITIAERNPQEARLLAAAFAITQGNGPDAYAQAQAALRFYRRTHEDYERELASYFDGRHFAPFRLGFDLDPQRVAELRELAEVFLDGGPL